MGPNVGQEFAGYRIERQLGRGGMGVVYLATHVRLGRRAALKVLAPEIAEQEGFQERFVRESRLAASLDHPNIVPVYDAGEHDGVLYIAMRFVEGTDLATVLEGAPEGLEPDRALSILGQIADALDTAHAEGLVHRDVKPGNVLIGAPTRPGGREWAYLTDFGLTKQLRATTRITQTGVFMGTLQYVAPEQIRGEDLDGRADQYALACMLFESLAGRPPFTKDVELALLSAHLSEPPPPITPIRPELPTALDEVLVRGMAKTPDGRFASCTELIDAARAATEAGVRPAAATVAALPPAPASPGSSPVQAPPTQPPTAPPRRSKLPWLVGALVALAAAGAGAFALLGGDDGGGTTGPSGPSLTTGGTTGQPTGTTGGPTGSTGDATGPPSGVFRIAYQANVNGGGDIAVMASDGTGLTPLAEGADSDSHPAFSPDGSKIAFVSNRDGDPEIYVMDADGGNVVRLTNDRRDQFDPAWSPDGSRIAFSQGAFTPRAGIFVMNADGSDPTRVTSGSFDVSPTWSPDGERIAYETLIEEAGSRIAVVDVDGSGFEVISKGRGQDIQPAWSPDGTEIAFSRALGRDPGDVYVMNPDGTGVERLTSDIGIDQEPAWSPDGSRLVFASTRDSSAPNCEELCLLDLYVMDADGTDVVRLFDDPFSAGAPSTAPL